MNLDTDVAAHNLQGLILNDIWYVREKIQKSGSQTGSLFSVGYIVEKDDKEYFLKAFNFNSFIQTAGNMMENLKEMTDAYNYEKNLSKHCKEKHVTKVSFVVDFGEANVDGFTIPIVPYLIFELAKGDIRKVINFTERLNIVWKFHSLHEIAIGLKQLHLINVSHQDLKPSNILVFNKQNDSKICDLGRSTCSEIKSGFLEMAHSGDLTYSPPEIWYSLFEKDWKKRTFAIDCYMLGSLITFYFTGSSMSALISNELNTKHRPFEWKGTFDEVEFYLHAAFSQVIKKLEDNINEEFYKDDIIFLIKHLCNPNPKKRGHPKNKNSGTNKYSLERVISKLNFLKYKAQIKLKG